MARELMLLVATVIVCLLAPGIHGTAHLSFDTDSQVNISRTGCGVTKLCVEAPDNCDPMNPACLFASIMVHTNASMSKQYLHVELSGMYMGMTNGYIAMGLTMNATMGTMVFVCAQDNGTFFFRTMHLQNDSATTLTPVETMVMGISGYLNGSMIQCEFKVPQNTSNSSVRVSNVNVLLGRGPTTGTTLGAFTRALNEGPHDLADPTSTVTAPTPAVPTTAAPTTAAASAPAAPAVLFLLCALIWPVVLRT